jgi:TIR domain
MIPLLSDSSPASERIRRNNSVKSQVFISYSGHDAFEASLLQYAIEKMLASERVKAWTYQRDQERSEKEIAAALKESVRKSLATVFIVSPSTIDGGGAQWMELAYADAFGVKTFVLLHHLEYRELKAKERGVPPLLLASQCNSALQWKVIVKDLRNLVKESKKP